MAHSRDTRACFQGSSTRCAAECQVRESAAEGIVQECTVEGQARRMNVPDPLLPPPLDMGPKGLLEIRCTDLDSGHLCQKWPKLEHRLYLQAVTSNRGISKLSRYHRDSISSYSSYPQTCTTRHDGDDQEAMRIHAVIWLM